MKKTLDQIRAAVALEKKGNIIRSKGDSDKTKSLPTMVQTNGLLGAIAFAVDKNENSSEKAYYSIVEAIVVHLKKVREQDPSIIPEEVGDRPEDLADYLAKKATPTQFRRITAEVLAFLNYLRRFAS